MKLYLWLAAFGAIVFGIGWISRDYRAEGSAPESTENEPPRTERSMRSIGPHIQNVREYAEELELSPDQLVTLQSLVDEVYEEVRRLDRIKFEYLDGTRERIDDLLTDEQMARLKELNEARWQKYLNRRVENSLAWMDKNAQLEPNQRERVQTVLAEYYEQLPKVMRRGRRSPETRKAMDELAATRDAALAEILPAEVLNAYQESTVRRGGRGDRGRWGDRRGGDRRRGEGRRGGRRGGVRPESDEASKTENPPFKQESEGEPREERKP